MRIITSLIAVFFVSSFAQAQKLKDIDAININTKFTLELTEVGPTDYSYQIVSTELFEEEFKMSSAFNLLDKNLASNQIQGILSSPSMSPEAKRKGR